MASGGVTKKGVSSNGNYKHRQNPQDQQQWTVLPNNLDLRGSSRSSKKQRNKEEYSIESSAQYNIMPSSNPNHISTSISSNKTSGSRQSEQQQYLADIEMGYQNVFRQHGEQTSHYQSQQGVDGRGQKTTENGGRKLYKENNIQKIPDTNAIVERLGHLREYMKDVTSVMGSLEKSDDPDTREQKKKLSHMLRQLQQEEQQYFNLLQQMLSANDEQTPDAADDGNAISNSLESNDKENNGEIEATLEHGEKLLKKMMESQEKMQSLKKQEADLLAMQKEAETKLAEAKAFHSTLMKREQAMKNEKERYIHSLEWNYRSQDNQQYNIGEAISNDKQTREKCPVGISVNLDRLNEGDHPHAMQSNSDELVPTGFEAAFENLKHRLQHLKDISNNNPPEQEEQLSMDLVESGDSKMEWHRKKLENKLKELQEKKKHMDTMLVELSALEQASAEIKNGHGSSNQLNTADSSMEEAQHLLDTIDAREKMKKLEEMKESLKQLRSLVNSIQPPPSTELLTPSNEDPTETISNSSRSSSQVAQHQAGTPRSHQYQPPTSQPKKDNIRRDKSNKFPVRRHYEAEGRANEDGDNNLPSSARTSISNIDDSWETDPQIQEKVRKLQDAKEKLQRLQGLMSAIENSKGTDYPTTLEYLQLLSAISDEEKQEEEAQQENHLNTSESKSCHDGEAVPHLEDLDRLDAVEERMQEQQRELEKLMKERLHLLSMQNQLTKIQQQFKNSHSAGEEQLRLQHKSLNQSCSNSNSSSSRGLSPCHQSRTENCLSGRQNLAYDSSSHINSNVNSHTEGRMSVTKKDNINSMSANLSGRVKHGKDTQTTKDSGPNATNDSLLMKGNDLDENVTFHELKRNLYDDMLRRQFNKQYSHNEDIHSQSCSSANSEFQEGSNSILAADTTVAATWGGSSTQNDLEDEHAESLEEQEGSEAEVQHDENIWQAQNRIPPSQQAFRRERAHSEQDTEPQIRRDNRLGSHNFKGDHVNRWNARKNYHQKQQRNQFPSVPNQDTHGNLCAASRLNAEESIQPQNLATPDSSSNPTVWQQFTHHIHQQLEHMNTLCQSIFHDQQALTSCFLSSSLPSPLAVGRSSHPVLSDSWLQNTYQFQQQQQLLLSLSQCYHMIHLQQLEIQYLHQCLQQHPDAEPTVLQTPVVNQEHVPEEFTFRPWITAPSANAQDSFPSAQNASVPTPTFVQSNVENNIMPVMPNSANNSFNIPAQTSSCNFSGQNAVTATLNNQVPPRTRANNFWDNFRSYSRQNMLSTSKSNEALSTNISSPQLQSLPADNLVTSCSYRPQLRTLSCAENTAQTNCLKIRRVPNTKLQEIMIKTKKPNSCKDGRQAGYPNRSMTMQQPMLKPKLSAKDTHVRENAPTLEPFLQNASTSESTHCFTSPNDKRTGGLEQRGSGNNNAVQDFVYNEVSKIISRAEGKPDLMQDLLQDFLRKFKDAQQANAALNSSGTAEHQSLTPRSEPSQISNIGPSTGAVRKRASNKRPKTEQPTVPTANTVGAAQCTESTNERIGRTEKEDSSHLVAELDLVVPEQEERNVGAALDSTSAGSQIVVNRSAQIAEEDMVYECDPEGETEPDVEAETDDTKDLAEADQSPGQRDHSQHFRHAESLPVVGATGTSYPSSASRSETTSTIATSPDPLRFLNYCEEEPDIGAVMDDAMHAQPTADELPTVDEVTLDDIPTKLTPLSEEEVQRQMPEETVAASSLLYDVVTEASDVAKEQGGGPF